MSQKIEFGSRIIEFDLFYLGRKSLSIKVHPDLKVEVLAPADAREEDLLKKIKSKAPWILKQIDHFNSFRPVTPPRRYISGETHLYLGRQYKLKIVPGNENSVKAYSGQLILQTSDPSNIKDVEQQLNQWYRRKAVIVFEELLADSLPKFSKYNMSKPEIFIRTMAKRWGSCTPSGKVILNLNLIKAPKGCIEYVMIHELCHLIYHSHTKQFFELQNKMMPDWKKWKNRLEYGQI